MELATIMARICRESTIKLTNVSPAEVVILRNLHQNKAGGEVVQNIQLTGEGPGGMERDGEKFNEWQRLCDKYGTKTCEKLWPGVNKSLPQTFAEVGLTVAAPVKPAAPVDEEPAKPIRKASKLV